MTARADDPGIEFFEQKIRPLLADPTKKTAEAYGVLRDFGGDIGVVANRWTFYIGKDGRIAAIDKAVKPATAASGPRCTQNGMNREQVSIAPPQACVKRTSASCGNMAPKWVASFANIASSRSKRGPTPLPRWYTAS